MTTKGVKVQVPFLAGVLIYSSRAVRRLGFPRIAGAMVRQAGRLAPGLRGQAWKAATKIAPLC